LRGLNPQHPNARDTAPQHTSWQKRPLIRHHGRTPRARSPYPLRDTAGTESPAPQRPRHRATTHLLADPASRSATTAEHRGFDSPHPLATGCWLAAKRGVRRLKRVHGKRPLRGCPGGNDYGVCSLVSTSRPPSSHFASNSKLFVAPTNLTRTRSGPASRSSVVNPA